MQVIPLIHRNKWQPPRLDEVVPQSEGGAAMEGVEEGRAPASLDDQAAMELIHAGACTHGERESTQHARVWATIAAAAAGSFTCSVADAGARGRSQGG